MDRPAGGITSSNRAAGRHLDFLDQIRGVAILWVFIFHAYIVSFGEFPHLNRWERAVTLPAALGWLGVSVFFVVSGFCIHTSYARQPDWAAFFKRRFFRIYPPYLVALLLFALIFPTTRLKGLTVFNAAQIGSHSFFVHNLSERSLFGINPSFWSMAVEVQLYAVYPLLLMLVARWGWKISLLIALVVEVTLVQAKGHWGLPAWLAYSPFAYWCSWSVGAAIGDAYLRKKTIWLPRGSLSILAALLALGFFVQPVGALGFLCVALATAVVIIRKLQAPPATTANRNHFSTELSRAGLWSYSLYLLHQPLVFCIPLLIGMIYPHDAPHRWLLFLISLASWFVIVPLAGVFYRHCEMPSNALGKSLSRVDRSPAPATVLSRPVA
ncbi:MAG: acyltransferase [Verrucomicrobiota bacterium]